MPGRTAALEAAGVGVRLRRDPRARRFTLRLAADASHAVLTLPARTPEAEARAFLSRNEGWLATALATRPAPVTVCPGARLPVDGRMVEIVAASGRSVRLSEGRLAVPSSRAPGPAVADWLKARARASIAPAAAAHAASLDRAVARISFRDTRSRWGSCSCAGRLSFSWRLAMAPPEVQAYLAAHEAAHLVEMNHSPRFWTLVERLMPGHAAPRAWLRREGPEPAPLPLRRGRLIPGPGGCAESASSLRDMPPATRSGARGKAAVAR